jgi:hypothetical protein
MSRIGDVLLGVYDHYQTWRLQRLFPESSRMRNVRDDIRRQREDSSFIIEEYVEGRAGLNYALAIGDRCSPGQRLISLVDGVGVAFSRLFDDF